MSGATTTTTRGIRTVRDLTDAETELWDYDIIIGVIGQMACVQILASHKAPVDEDGPDRLVCNLASNGKYSVKVGYKNLFMRTTKVDDQHKAYWNLIWNRGDILPRVRLHMWKLANGALPLSGVITSRISKTDPFCATCGSAKEDVPHLLFICPFSRGRWFASPLAIRSDKVWKTLQIGPQFMTNEHSDEQWTQFANVAWAIWRCRNDRAYAGKIPTIEQFNKYLFQISNETLTASTKRYANITIKADYPTQSDEFMCWINGSWVGDWKGGIGCVIWHKEKLLRFRSKGVKSCCPLQSEAMALREGMLEVRALGLQNCLFLTNNKELRDLVTQPFPPIDTDWKVFSEVQKVWLMLQQNKEFKCSFMQRSHIEMADYLAKKKGIWKDGIMQGQPFHSSRITSKRYS